MKINHFNKQRKENLMELKEAIEKAYDVLDALDPDNEGITLEKLYKEVLKTIPTLTREEIYKAVVTPEKE